MEEEYSKDFEKFYNKALRFLSFRPRSEKEIRDYLQKKKTEELLIEGIVNKLKEQKFLNDEEFAKMWIENRMRFKPRSLRLIKIELKQKGINKETIEKLVQSSESRVQSDQEMARKIIEKKIKKYQDLPKQEVYQKLGRILAQKGFAWDIIRQGIDEFYKNKV